jgi:hypothetical protein
MQTKKILLVVMLALSALALGACSAIGGLTGGGGNTAAGGSATLWADVPRMDGLNPSSGQMPFMAEMFMQMMVAQAANGTGSGDVVVFDTSNSFADIQAYYTAERMAGAGWNSGDQATCFTGEEQGVADVGLFCAFARTEGADEVVLVLVAVPGENNQNSVFFVRLADDVTE